MTDCVNRRMASLARVRPVSFYGVSLALHAVLAAAILLVAPRVDRRATPVSVEIIERRPAAAPEAERPHSPPPPEPRPVLRPDRRVVKVPRPRLPDGAPPPSPHDAPPPPNSPPPQDTKPGPIRIGISMSSTTTAGEYATPSGDTLYGAPPEQPDDAPGGRLPPSERYSPPSQVTSLPEPLGCDIPKSEYPEEARRLGIEGEVKLRLVIDREGVVRDAKVLRDPGHGFGKVAQRSVRTYCRFRPARKDGEAVATEIPYTIRFEL